MLEEIRAERATLLAIQARLNAEISVRTHLPRVVGGLPSVLADPAVVFDSRKRGLEEELSDSLKAEIW